MTGEEHRAMREALGALALGHLPDAEAEPVRRHLEGCGACREELAELSATARQLGGLDPDALSPEPATPPLGLEERVVAAVRAQRGRQRRRRRLRLGGLGAAAAGALAASFALGLAAAGDPAPAGPTVEPVTVVASAPGVHAEAGLVAHTWGTELKLDARGLRSGAAYRVELVSAAGERVAAGTFIGTGEGELRCNLNAAVLREAARSATVYDDSGRVVIQADFA